MLWNLSSHTENGKDVGRGGGGGVRELQRPLEEAQEKLNYVCLYCPPTHDGESAPNFALVLRRGYKRSCAHYLPR
jgi:hypothetical protein